MCQEGLKENGSCHGAGYREDKRPPGCLFQHFGWLARQYEWVLGYLHRTGGFDSTRVSPPWCSYSFLDVSPIDSMSYRAASLTISLAVIILLRSIAPKVIWQCVFVGVASHSLSPPCPCFHLDLHLGSWRWLLGGKHPAKQWGFDHPKEANTLTGHKSEIKQKNLRKLLLPVIPRERCQPWFLEATRSRKQGIAGSTNEVTAIRRLG